MKKQKKRNKAYNPNKHRINSAAAFNVIQNAHDAAYDAKPLDADQIDELGIGYYAALKAVRQGKGTPDQLGTLAGAINISLVLAENGIGPEYLDLLKEAKNAIFRTIQRERATGKVVFYGPDSTKIGEALDVHDMQILVVSKNEMVAAVTEVRRRIDAGHYEVTESERLAA